MDDDRSTLRVFVSVGEPSGDLHGANLIRSLRSLRPQLQFSGLGGPLMAAAGQRQADDVTSVAAMGIVQVLKLVPRFWRAFRKAVRQLDTHRPDAVVLIDCPGFNWWIARAARRRRIPVFYYGVPQLWAWGRWRVRKMKRLVDHALCKLPFEAQWYRDQGIQAEFVGHPYFDELLGQRLSPATIAQLRGGATSVVTILPGSRRQEVVFNLPLQLRAAQHILRAVPGTRFLIASFNAQQAQMAQTALEEFDLPVQVCIGQTAEAIAAADACIACSGSVSLELLFHRRPSVVVYRVRRSAWLAARWLLLSVRYITLANLLACDDRFETAKGPFQPDSPDADAVPFPEYPCYWDCSRQVAAHVVQWLQSPADRRRRVALLDATRRQVVGRGASDRAAEYILSRLPANPVASRAA